MEPNPRISEIAVVKTALETHIEEGLSLLLKKFQEETSLSVSSIQIKLTKQSTLSRTQSVISGVRVGLALPGNLNIVSQGEHHGQSFEQSGNF